MMMDMMMRHLSSLFHDLSGRTLETATVYNGTSIFHLKMRRLLHVSRPFRNVRYFHKPKKINRRAVYFDKLSVQDKLMAKLLNLLDELNASRTNRLTTTIFGKKVYTSNSGPFTIKSLQTKIVICCICL